MPLRNVNGQPALPSIKRQTDVNNDLARLPKVIDC